jgi:hypothetical protein
MMSFVAALKLHPPASFVVARLNPPEMTVPDPAAQTVGGFPFPGSGPTLFARRLLRSVRTPGVAGVPPTLIAAPKPVATLLAIVLLVIVAVLIDTVSAGAIDEVLPVNVQLLTVEGDPARRTAV